MTLLNPKAVKQSWLQRVLGIPPTVLENCLEMCQRHFKYTPQPNEALYPNKVHYPLAPWEGDCDDFAATLASVLGKATNAPTYFHYCYAPSGVFHVGVSCKDNRGNLWFMDCIQHQPTLVSDCQALGYVFKQLKRIA